MIVKICDERTRDTEFVYTENIWTGKRTLSYAGRRLVRKKRNLFALPTEQGEFEFRITGNLFKGVNVESSLLPAPVQVRRKLTVLEYTLAVLALVLSIGCGILGGWVGGVIGGALQGAAYGAVGGVAFAVEIYAVSSIEKKWLKYLVCAEICIVAAALAFFAGYGFALLRIATA